MGPFNARNSRLLAVIGVALTPLGCDESAPSEGLPNESEALVITSDYQSGAASTVDPVDWSVHQNAQVIHSDSVCRFDPVTELPYIVSRLGSDSITVLDPKDGWRVRNQYSVGAGTNAQDIAVVNEDRAYVPRFAAPELLIVHPTQGNELGRVDLSPYADEDGNPEAAQAAAVNGTVYVALQRLDDTWTPTDYSSLVLIDGEDGEIVEEVKLTAKNPVGKLRYSEPINGLVLIEAGTFGLLDGGIEYLDIDTKALSGLVITEAVLGGDVSDAVVVSRTKGYAVIGVYEGESAKTRLVSFDPSSGIKLEELILSDGWELSYLELTRDSTELWVSDRAMTDPGIRIFDVATDQELTDAPIDVGLPPTMVCFGL